jgi:hypothetical protein
MNASCIEYEFDIVNVNRGKSEFAKSSVSFHYVTVQNSGYFTFECNTHPVGNIHIH